MKSRYIQATVGQPTFEELKILAVRKDISMSALLRIAISQFLAQNPNEAQKQEVVNNGKNE